MCLGHMQGVGNPVKEGTQKNTSDHVEKWGYMLFKIAPFLEGEMFEKRKLRKIGYSNVDIIEMEGQVLKVKEILELGKMGYSKSEIEDMRKEAEKEQEIDTKNFEDEIENLKGEIARMVKEQQIKSVRETAAENVDTEQSVNDILNSFFSKDV